MSWCNFVRFILHSNKNSNKSKLVYTRLYFRLILFVPLFYTRAIPEFFSPINETVVRAIPYSSQGHSKIGLASQLHCFYLSMCFPTDESPLFWYEGSKHQIVGRKTQGEDINKMTVHFVVFHGSFPFFVTQPFPKMDYLC